MTSLRIRVAVATILVTIPVGLLLLWYDAARQHEVAERLLAGHVESRMATERDRCEAAPESFGGELPGGPPRHLGPPPPGPPPPGAPPPPPHGPPPPPPRPRARPAVIFAYDTELRSRNPKAPAIPESLVRAIRDASVAVAPTRFLSTDVEVLVAMPWRTGPCAYMFGRGSTDPGWGVLPESNLWLLPTVAVFAAMLLALGPVVRRIQKLTEAVQASAKSAYASAITEDGRDEIGELARAFNAAGVEIRARERALRDFLANTTHDVMIPLTVLQGHLASLRENGARGEPLDARILVSAMAEAHYMASLVHNLSAVARLEAAEAPTVKDTVDLTALVQRVVARHRPIARELGVALESSVPGDAVHVLGDVTLLEQAASNVTYNAIRYNRKGGHVAVILERTRGDGFSLRVIDDGPGIPEAQRSRLAERGVRGDEARTRAPDGQGLGLHIAYRAVRLHGFELTLEDSEYGGLEVKMQGTTS
ncbi:HAMP domain-containing histidine kinase [Pendulispora brunnea]|uniref:histidine kinase n=1 Tax=Pendulispora brunnea TaxID=2905690 RepID=A0ABZ2KNB3_9BACT